MAEHKGGGNLKVDICICTFRRDSIIATLESIAAQDLPDGVSVRVIVADNDDEPSARSRVEQTAAHLGLDLAYRHCPARNISLARNGAIDAASGDWIAFLDDDEVAAPVWLAALLARAYETGADVVLGPVLPVYQATAPAWMRAGEFHATRPVVRQGQIVTGYAGNALIRRGSQAFDGQRFDPARGRSGGEDTEFFDRLFRRGAQIAFAPDAVAREEVPPDRARLGWLLRRRFRFGQTHGALLVNAKPGTAQRLREFLLAASKAGASGAATLANAGRPKHRIFWALRTALHAGVASRLLGYSELTEYGGQDHHDGRGAAPPDGGT